MSIGGLKKIWNWIKKNYLIISTIFMTLVALIAISFKKKPDAEFIERRLRSEEIKNAKIIAAKEQELETKKDNLKKYYETIDYINYEFAQKSGTLDDEKKKKVKEIVDSAKPAELKMMIDKEFGF